MTTHPRIAFVSHSAQPAGGEIYLLRLAQSLTSVLPSLHFMSDGEVPARARALGQQVVTLTDRPGSQINRRGHLLLLLSGAVSLWRNGYKLDSTWPHPVDYVVAWSIRALPASYVFARRRKVPLIWSVHDRLSSDYFGWLNKSILKILGRILADGYIVNSKTTLATLSTGGKPVSLLYPGIEPRQVEHVLTPKPRDAPLEIVMVGRLAEWKGQHILLEALSRINVGREHHVTIVGAALFGEDDYAQKLHQTAASNVSFTGHSNSVDQYIDRADILVHASITPEPFGLAVLEGMRSGCAVIATTPGGPAEMIKHEQSGLLVGCNDVGAMTSAITLLIEDSNLRTKLGDAAQLRSKDFDINATAIQLETWLSHAFPTNNVI